MIKTYWTLAWKRFVISVGKKDLKLTAKRSEGVNELSKLPDTRTICSTAWYFLDVKAIYNSTDEVEIGNKELKTKDLSVYDQASLKFKVDEENLIYLHSLTEHFLGYCEPDNCDFCNREED